MPGGSTTLHEAIEKLRPETIDLHRALVSLMEELEAVDWYGQRVDATEDDALRAILIHNRDEEKEHACMILEWIRRHDPKFDEYLRKLLFQEGSIVGARHEEVAASGDGSLGLGSLREELPS
jgi:uncharacterized protein